MWIDQSILSNEFMFPRWSVSVRSDSKQDSLTTTESQMSLRDSMGVQ